MAISGIQSSKAYEAMSSGYRINRAADDAAGLAISQKLLTQSNGFSVGSDNAKDGQSLLNIADGALAGMQDSMQRMYELSIRSLNPFASDSDKQAYQMEINGLKDHIQSIAVNTNFNTLKLLDGSMADLHLATNPEGGGLSIQLENSTLASLGLADYDVTGNFDLKALDQAMERISTARSRMGAQYNRLDHTVAYNDYANYNTVAANSRIRDTDYGEESIKKNRDEALQSYRIFTMNAQMNQNAGFLGLF